MKTIKNLRRCAALLLCMCMLATVAFASPGDAILTLYNYDQPSADDDYVNTIVTAGDTLVLLGDRGVYTWKPGDAKATPHLFVDTNTNFVYNDIYAGIIEELGGAGDYEGTNVNIVAAYSDGTDVYAAISVQGYVYGETYRSESLGVCLAKIVIDDAGAHYEAVEDGELDWAPLTTIYDSDEYGNENSYPQRIENAIYVDGSLYGTGWIDDELTLVCVPTDGSYASTIPDVDRPEGVSQYTDGKLLLFYSDYTDSGTSYRFVSFDVETEETEEILTYTCKPGEYMNSSSILYSPENDKIYTAVAGVLVGIDMQTGTMEEVNDLPPNSYFQQCCMLSGGYFVGARGDSVVIRNIDPTVRPQRRLSVLMVDYLESIEKIYQTYGNAHGDVSISLRENYSEINSIVEGMMNRSEEYDIIVLSTQTQAYKALKNRGYMADLSGSAVLSEAFEKLYPNLKENYSYNGKLVALPTNTNANSIALNSSTLEKLNMTVDEFPTNWVDFLNYLPELYQKCKAANIPMVEDYMNQSEIRSVLFERILADYMLYMSQSETPLDFNTPELMNALSALEALDYDAMDIPAEISDDFWMNYRGQTTAPLLYFYNNVGLAYISSQYSPLLLSMSADAPTYLGLQTGAIFVNPYSKNQDLAIEFIETALQEAAPAVVGSFMDIDVQPMRPSYYEEYTETLRQDIANLKAEYEQADEANKQEWAESIEWMEKDLLDREKYAWEISPEAIEWYKAHNDLLVAAQSSIYNLLYGNDSDVDEAQANSDLYMQFYAGKLTSIELVKRLNDKFSMMLLEGN